MSPSRYLVEIRKPRPSGASGAEACFGNPLRHVGEPSAVLKYALDWVYPDRNRKAVGFVSYGSAGGMRRVEQLRSTAAEL